MNLFLKRCFDIVCSLIGLIFLSPIFLIIAIGIKIDSKGPVFFKQERRTINGKIFKIYKFRSMCINAEKQGTGLFNFANDSRVTKIGRFLRDTSLDELPQLLNVLMGQMSLVGPRPSLPKEVAKFEPWMLKRLEVKPGLTCYWQVMGRNDIDFEEWMKLDIKYIYDRNIFLDIKLIFKTFFVLFGDESAS